MRAGTADGTYVNPMRIHGAASVKSVESVRHLAPSYSCATKKVSQIPQISQMCAWRFAAASDCIHSAESVRRRPVPTSTPMRIHGAASVKSVESVRHLAPSYICATKKVSQIPQISQMCAWRFAAASDCIHSAESVRRRPVPTSTPMRIHGAASVKSVESVSHLVP